MQRFSENEKEAPWAAEWKIEREERVSYKVVREVNKAPRFTDRGPV